MSRLTDRETERVRRIWDRQAERFDRQMGFWERVLFPGDRKWACHQARGDVLEVAVGTGRNLEHYPDDVRVTGVDLSPEMLARARRRAEEVRPDADLREGDAQALPFADDSFDTVVCTYSLCSIPDDRRAVAEMARVLRPGGSVILVEHVASPRRGVRAVQWLIHQITHRLALEHMLRRPRRVVAETGLDPVHLERRKAGIVDRIVARKQPTRDAPDTDPQTRPATG
ncbi:MAG: class I SAM-dependent methyltransferase [Actinobacteria bacterium]|nr:class I SAM-dependent methyltransferase [Actinomycetota bacterium]